MMDAMDVLLGLDVGTTNCKAMAMGTDGRCLGLASVPTPWTQVATGAETEPRAILGAVLEAASTALAQVDSGARGTGARIIGVGVAGMAEAGVLLDAHAQPLAPVIAWYDSRGVDLAGELDREVGAPTFASITGLKLTDRPSVVKYRWMRREIDAAAAGVRWLSIPEWVAHALGADPVTEPSLAGRTGFFDIVDAGPSTAMLSWARAPETMLGEIRPAGTVAGRVAPEAPLPGASGAPITVAGHDHLVAGVGAGSVQAGDLLDSCGTSEALVRTVPRELSRAAVTAAVQDGISVGRQVGTGGFQLMSGLRSGLGMWRFLKLMGMDASDVPQLDKDALAMVPRPDAPVVDEIWTERAVLRNVGYEPVPAEIWRAAVEAVQRRAVAVKGTLESVAGPTERIVATGGGLRSAAVRVLKREILGRYVMPDVEEAGARGAAVFAAVAAEVVESPESLAPRIVPGA